MTRCATSIRLRFLVLTVLIILSSGKTAQAIELVANGAARYAIYAGDDLPPSSRMVVDTLRVYIHKISGADLAVTNRSEPSSKQIVIELGKTADPKLAIADLGTDGFRIKTIGESLYITAQTERGLHNAVYTFLETYLGCRKFSPTVTVIPERPTITLPHIDDTQVPKITFRMQNFHDSGYNAWHKLDTQDNFGLFVHTFKVLIPPEKYFGDHPEYFSELNGQRTPEGQLCLTNPDVYRIIVEELRRRMQEKPQATFWSVSQNDTYVPCGCPSCRAIDSVEGSPSGSLLAFVNRIAAEFPDKTISTLAYQYSRSAPKSIAPRPNVNIMLCSIECNRRKPLADDSANASFVKDVHDWTALTHNIFLWDYVIQFRNLVSPFPNLRVLQPNIRFFAANGITTVFEQGLSRMYGEFAELRAYLIAKLLWNPDIDIDSVMNDFLQGFYGPGAPYIRAYIDTMHDALAASGDDLDIYGYPWPSENGYLSPRMLAVYDSLFDLAEAAVKTDSAFLHRVQTARLPLQFAHLEQAKYIGIGDRGFFVKDIDGGLHIKPDLDSLLTVFVSRCKAADIPALWEMGTSPDEYYASTRAFLDGSLQRHLAIGKLVVLDPPASPKYHHGEASALTNGLHAWDDYHMHWLGFEGEDMDAAIDLGTTQTISAIETNFLQDINSWIFMPHRVEFLVSDNGREFRSVGAVDNSTPPEKNGAIIAPFNARFEPTEARYVRVKTSSWKTCPGWHKGSGGLAWIFIDEIVVH
ncbi:MAG: DUF4838 domain-containing protein [candidate division Zixibacteria bacterium]|nr:DUF4838 domain-containing protein [candidate division Zixibacteria bacterium]